MSEQPAVQGPGLSFERVRTRIARILRNLRRRPDERQASMEDTDQNATRAASAEQTASDVDDLAAVSPADEGGEG